MAHREGIMISNKLLFPNDIPDHLFQQRFRVERPLGKGGFGVVYRGVQKCSGEMVAIKLEKISNSSRSVLFHEARTMQEIQKTATPDGLPALARLRYFGQEGGYRVLIMSLMGRSLESLHQERLCFSLKTTLMIGMQVVSRLEYLHNTGYLHRDLKPDNFVLGLGEHKNRIHLIDFGLSTRYLSGDGLHRPEREDRGFVGTARYASARTHEGFSQSRRDDIEQLVYVMIYLYRGRLPWSGLGLGNRREKTKRIGSLKRNLSYGEICAGCPRSFLLLLNYARKMKFEETPAYEMIRLLLTKELAGQQEACDNMFDWDPNASCGAVELPSGLLEREEDSRWWALRMENEYGAFPHATPAMDLVSYGVEAAQKGEQQPLRGPAAKEWGTAAPKEMPDASSEDIGGITWQE